MQWMIVLSSTGAKNVSSERSVISSSSGLFSETMVISLDGRSAKCGSLERSAGCNVFESKSMTDEPAFLQYSMASGSEVTF